MAHRGWYAAAAGALGLALLAGSPGPAEAQMGQAVRTGGMVTGSQEVVSEFPQPDGRVIRRVHMSLVVTADDPASIWHLGSQDCLATYTFAADGSLIGGRGACDLVSPGGDVWWLTLEARGTDPIRWRGLGGTGRFAGVEHSGTTVAQAEWGDGKWAGRWEGTMTRR